MELTSLKKINKACEKRREEIKHERLSGRKVVGYFCNFMPVEIIHALDLIPLRLSSCSDLCLEHGKIYFHENMCPFTRATIGEFMEKGGFYLENVDLIAGTIMCMQAHAAITVLKKYTKKPALFLGYPLNPPRPVEEEYFTAEMEHFARELEKFSNKKLTDDSLRSSIGIYNEIRGSLMEIYQFLAQGPSPLEWSHMFNLVSASFTLNPGAYLCLLKELLKEIGGASPQKGDQSPRIMITGSTIVPGDLKLVKTIEDLGGKIVVDDLCTGLRSFQCLTVDNPSLKGLAHVYLHGAIPCAALQNPSLAEDRRINNMLQLIQQYKVDGVVYYNLRFCDNYRFKLGETKKILKQKMDIPLLSIDTEYGDSDLEQIKTMVKAFIEMLKEKQFRVREACRCPS